MQVRTLVRSSIAALILLFMPRMLFPECVFGKKPWIEVVSSSDVVAIASVTAIRGRAGNQFAQFRVTEVQKGQLGNQLELPFINDELCEFTIEYDLGSRYVIFLQRRSNEKGLEYGARLKISAQVTVDNMRRLVQIAGTDDIRKQQALYLEVFNSGEPEFFMEACKALIELKFEDQGILQRGLLQQWTELSWEEEEWLPQFCARTSSSSLTPPCTQKTSNSRWRTSK